MYSLFLCLFMLPDAFQQVAHGCAFYASQAFSCFICLHMRFLHMRFRPHSGRTYFFSASCFCR